VEGFLKHYAFINDTILRMVSAVPDDGWDWSPRSGMWTFRQLFVHIANGRHVWLHLIDDEQTPVVDPSMTVEDITELLRASWERIEAFGRDAGMMATTYDYGRRGVLTGAEVITSRLVHDVHHRSEILSYLAQLGIEAAQIQGFERYGPQPDPLSFHTP
jgi:uncharacterized damage-inducible protein DinB